MDAPNVRTLALSASVVVYLGSVVFKLLRSKSKNENHANDGKSSKRMQTWQELRDMNRRNWDERVAHHCRPCASFYASCLKELRGGSSCLARVDANRLRDIVRGKTLLHLMCHFGLDTLSWKVEGAASVVGLDFSEQAIQKARYLASELRIKAEFVCADVMQASVALRGRRFHVVFTSIGVLCWIQDVRAWAKQVSACLVPGGTFYIRDCHPMLFCVDEASPLSALRLRYPYFERKEPLVSESEFTYTEMEQGARIRNKKVAEWNHGLGRIIQALLDAGLTIRGVREGRCVEWEALRGMEKGRDGMFRLPAKYRDACPLSFTVMATKD